MNKYPSGYRFNPTDEEIITHYLLPKISNQLLPDVNLPMVAINYYSPEKLIKEFQNSERFMENELIFFTKRIQKYNKGRRPNRITVGGFWKPTGIDRKITNSNGTIIGKRTNLDYYERVQGEDGCRRTPWKMHEYFPHCANEKENKKFQELVLCKIYLNSRNKDKDNVEVSELTANVDDSNLVPEAEEETVDSQNNNNNNNVVIIQDTANNNNGYALPYESFMMEQPNNTIYLDSENNCSINTVHLDSGNNYSINTIQMDSGNSSFNINQEYMGSSNINQECMGNSNMSANFIDNYAGTSSHHFLAQPEEPAFSSMSGGYQMYSQNNLIGNQSSLIRSSEYPRINVYNNHSHENPPPPTIEPVVGGFAPSTSSILGCPISYNFTTDQNQNYNT